MKKLLLTLGTLITLGFITLMIVSFVQTRNEPVPTAQAVKTIEKPTVAGLLKYVNEERARVGVAPLVLDPLLNQSAQMKSDDMYNNNYFGHTNTDGRQGYWYVHDVGKQCIFNSENIIWGKPSFSVQEAVSGWIESPRHYEALIDPRYESTGFGIADTKITEHFCDER